MTTIEALRLQLDDLQKEKQELEVRNLKLSQNHCNREAGRIRERKRPVERGLGKSNSGKCLA